MINGINDEVILAARLLLATLFLIFGWRKLTDYSGTVSQMVQLGAPMPVLAAAIATFMELPVAFAVAVGAFARPSALLMFFYTLGTALIGHRYWTITGEDRIDSMDGFYKNLSIMGGFLLLYITGAGKYSIDVLCGMPRHNLVLLGRRCNVTPCKVGSVLGGCSQPAIKPTCRSLLHVSELLHRVQNQCTAPRLLANGEMP
jgi:putative oxidoreductase